MVLRLILKKASSAYSVKNESRQPSLSSVAFLLLPQSFRKIEETFRRKMATSSKQSDKVVPREEVVRFINDCMCKVGTTPDDAATVAHHLMTADYRGLFSHGLNRMTMYVHEINIRLTDPSGKPEVINDCQVRFINFGSFLKILQIFENIKNKFFF